MSYRLDLPAGELQVVIGAGMMEVDREIVAVVVVSKKVPNAVEASLSHEQFWICHLSVRNMLLTPYFVIQVKANKFLSFRFVSVVNYAYLTSKKDYDTVKATLIHKSEAVSLKM